MYRRIAAGTAAFAVVSVAVASQVSPTAIGEITWSSANAAYVSHNGVVVAARKGMKLRGGDRVFTRAGGMAAFTVGRCDQQIGETSIARISAAMTSDLPCIVSTQTFAAADPAAGLSPTTTPTATAGGSAGAGSGAAAGAGAAGGAAGAASAGFAASGGISSITMLFAGIAGAAAAVAGATAGGGNAETAASAPPVIPVVTPTTPSNPVTPPPPDPVTVPEPEPTPISA